MNSFLGQVQAFAFNFAPTGWLPCNGQLLRVSENQPLFALLGPTYGGDGRTTFGLPKLAPIGGSQGPNYFICVSGGEFPPRS